MCGNPFWEVVGPYLFFVSELLVIVGFVASIILIFKKNKNNAARFILILISISASVVLVFLVFFAFFILVIEGDSPNGSYYFPLNAAVKNTCYLDPQRVHCPTNLSELILIEDKNFRKYLDNSYLFYEYRPETHEYTLIALKKGTERGVIFDPRFIGRKDYDYGTDVAEVKYRVCDGRVTIDNGYLPPFDGLWNHLTP